MYLDQKCLDVDAPLKKHHILVADDDPFNRELLSSYLVKLGQTCESACNGLQAVEAARKSTFDLVFMDLQMPIMGGLEATSEIRRFNNSTPIVALTTNARELYQQKCITAGMDAYESKPLTLKRLVSIIRHYTNSV